MLRLSQDSLWLTDLKYNRIGISTRRQQLFRELSAHNWGWPRRQRTRYEALIRLCRVLRYSAALYDCVALAFTLSQRQGAVLSPGNRSVQCARTELLTAVYLATSHESPRRTSTIFITASVSVYTLLDLLLYHDETKRLFVSYLIGTNFKRNLLFCFLETEE